MPLNNDEKGLGKGLADNPEGVARWEEANKLKINVRKIAVLLVKRAGVGAHGES